ncbi:MAG TPA: PSD1 and planctomycete cytochrome C domain-containing protein [Bryobacteraceae bacterium]|nr:PSD1 and planctomycete cytochrome C domain-containing protein [Bryobacteraceae bacterium]
MIRSIAILFSVAALSGAEGDDFFESRIRPVLAEKCYGCHSSKLREPKANLQLDTRAGLRKGGDSGPVILPGDPAGSRLLTAISYTDFHLRMPPTGKLPDAAIADFKSWIAGGAPDPRVDGPVAAARKAGIDLDRGRKFWAFQPLEGSPWPSGGIDSFLLAKLEAKSLRPAPETSRRAWLRRVTFDLTGLPPTPAEVDAFTSDLSADAYPRVVDRLLASPQYGERWGRHWLDLVRYAETNGHEYDNNKLDAWQYRDYVIRALNEDVPFDAFVREHLAGDLLVNPRLSKDGARLESPIATNYLWFGEVLNSATDSAKSKADNVDNQLDVTSKAFLGLTVACARCHDHKFDPIPTLDYYGLAGILHSTGMREAVIDSPARAETIRKAHAQARPITRNPGKAKFRLRPSDEVWADFSGPGWGGWFASGEAFARGPHDGVADSAGAGANELVGSLTSPKFRMPKHWVHVRMAATKGDKSLIEREPVRLTLVADDYKSVHYLGSGKGEFEWISMRMTLPYQRTCYFEIVDRSRTGNIAVDAIVFSEESKPPETEILEKAEWREPEPLPVVLPESTFGMIAWDEAPTDTRLHIRGSHQNLGDPVPRHFLQVLWRSPEAPVLQGSGRLALANWMTTEAAPLLSRVYVNRVWKHHFGQGLVRTPDNFGLTGERPAHRELLDALAARFIAGGWSTKQLHRDIVLSAAYRRSSRSDKAAETVDPRNELLHHFPVQRLEAESLRDAILSVAGTLSPKMYGPSVVPYISKYQEGRGKPKSGPLEGNGRRSIYIEVRRNFLTPMFLAFDYPLPISTMGARSVSTVPSQALILMNNEFILEQAGKWAERVAREAGPEPPNQVKLLFRQAFARDPESWETAESVQFLQKGRPLADLAHVLFNSAEFLYVE